MNQEFLPQAILEKGNFKLTNFELEEEGRAYKACTFKLNNTRVICRTAKATPKKEGQFVTFWKRNAEGVTVPFSEDDAFDFYVINVHDRERFGQFIIPKAVGLEQGLVHSAIKPGKRGFRVYPSWVVPTNNQAKQTQSWQLNYFVSLITPIDIDLLNKRYTI
ncbi:MepB family protein [Formosa sediminum]|uniref:MepB family protein n=1 Tax=Formosa sediminum TaxID=2594004 RepID=UPI001FEBBD99|nr:MepB family protein [Formosa sediminum]